mmetsp:Transcript_24657/g.38341  ORF Transcript_24657/g.38341 Transcript_24657/m.38341 type:complete len:91 (-) Transcript_24657:496-768(-)
MPAIRVLEDSTIVFAYEVTVSEGNHIRVMYFKDFATFKSTTPEASIDITRSLSEQNEGTPSFDDISISGQNPYDSVIHLRFHFFDDGVRD